MDTSALYALISSSDEFHEIATVIFKDLVASDAELWAPSYVLVEFGALVASRLGFGALQSFVDAVEGVLNTFWIEGVIHSAAWAALKERQGRGLSFVDWTVLLSSRSLQARLFTFDTGFTREGVSVIP